MQASHKQGFEVGTSGDLVLFSSLDSSGVRSFRQKKSVAELLYDGGRSEKRSVYYQGRPVAP